MHLWFERKIPESTDADIDQTERRMIDADVAAALCAITTIADFAAFELAEELLAFGDLDLFRLPQRERAHWRGGIAPAIFAMTVTHLQRFAAHLDLHRSAVTSACMCLRMIKIFNQEESESGKQESRKGISEIEGKAARVAAKKRG